MTIRELLKSLPLVYDSNNSGNIENTNIRFVMIYSKNDNDLNDLDRDLIVDLIESNKWVRKNVDDIVDNTVLDRIPSLNLYVRNCKIVNFLNDDN